MRERTSRPSTCVRPCRRSTLLAGWLAAASLAACDVPTELPAVDTRWVVPAEETRFGVDDLLPSDVQLTATGNAFEVTIDPISFSETLGGLCAVCIAANGLNVPKPPFIEQFAASMALPLEVSAFTLASGSVGIQLQNGTNFDILRPAAGAFGEIAITITDDADGDVLGTLTIDGVVTAFPAGTTLTRTMTLSPTTVQGSLVATVDVDSPLGDFVTIDVTHLVSATVTPSNIVVSSVTIDVAGHSAPIDPVDVPTGDLDQDLVDRVQAGSLIVEVENPFRVAASFQVALAGPSLATIQKTEAISAAAASTVEIDFTLGEIRSILAAADVTLTGSAVVSPSAPQITVMPGEELVLDVRLDLTLRLGG